MDEKSRSLFVTGQSSIILIEPAESLADKNEIQVNVIETVSRAKATNSPYLNDGHQIIQFGNTARAECGYKVQNLIESYQNMSRAEPEVKVHDSVGRHAQNMMKEDSGPKVQNLIEYYQNMSRAEPEVKVHDSVGRQAQNMTKEDSGAKVQNFIKYFQNMPQNPHRCFQCKTTLKKTAKFAKCGRCQNVFHFPCTQTTHDKYNFILNNGGQWYCESCSNCAGNLLHRILALEENQKKMHEQAEFYQNYSQELEQKLENATQRNEHLVSKIEEVMMTADQKLEQLMRNVALLAVTVNQLITPHLNNPQTEGTSTVSDKTSNDDPRKRTDLDEVEERRKSNQNCNLIFYGLLESTKENPKDRVEEDRTAICRALEKITLDIQPCEIVKIIRAGRKSYKGRPLVVKLSTKELRDDIVSKGKELKIATNLDVGFTRSHLRAKALYAEAKEKNQNDLENYE